jgi:hypothetical protein
MVAKYIVRARLATARACPEEATMVKSHDVCNNVTSRLIDQLAISNAGSTSLCATIASMRAIDSGLK